MPGKDIYVRRQVRLPAEKQPSRRSINVVRRFVVNARQLSRPPAHTQAPTSIGQCGDCAMRKKTPHREPLCEELDPQYDTSLFVYKNDVRSEDNQRKLLPPEQHFLTPNRLSAKASPHAPLRELTALPRPSSRGGKKRRVEGREGVRLLP